MRATHVLPCHSHDAHLRVNITFADSSYEVQAIDRGEYITINTVAVRFASVEDLIIHKIMAGATWSRRTVGGPSL